MKTAKRLRVVLYARVSSDEQRDHQTIKTQIDILQRWMDQHEEEVEVVARVNDDGVTGTIPLPLRESGKQIVALARAGEIDQVVVTRLDRLGRTSLILLQTQESLQDLGVTIHAVLENVDDPLDYELRAVLAADERRRFLKRSREGTERAAREGRYLGGIVPLGYRVEGRKPNAHLVPSDRLIWAGWSEAELVRQLYRWLVYDSWSTVQIADHLNALGVPTVYTKDERLLKDERGRRTRHTENIWRPGRIRNLLVNPVYKGLYLYGRRSKYKRETIPATVEALVDEELWDAAQSQLAANRIRTKHGGRVNLLKSLARCSLCGLTYCAYEGSRKVVWYRCGGQMKYRSKAKGAVVKCSSRSFRADVVESLVLADVKRWLLNPDDGLVEELRQEARKPHGAVDEAERSSIERSLAAMPGKRDRLLEARLNDLITLEELQDKLNDLKEQESSLMARLAQLDVLTEPAEAPLDEDLVEAIRRRIHNGLDASAWQQIIALLVRRIDVETKELDNGKKSLRLIIHYRFGGVDATSTGTGSWRPRA